jgi:UDPglucose 6-dehydrogenase
VPLLTDWPEYATISPHELAEVTAGRRIVDGRYQLDPTVWRAAGWHYRASGIPGPARSNQLT